MTCPPRVIWTTVLEAGGTVDVGTVDDGTMGTDVDADEGGAADDSDGWPDGAGREATDDPHPAVNTRRNTASSTSRLVPTIGSLTGFGVRDTCCQSTATVREANVPPLLARGCIPDQSST